MRAELYEDGKHAIRPNELLAPACGIVVIIDGILLVSRQ